MRELGMILSEVWKNSDQALSQRRLGKTILVKTNYGFYAKRIMGTTWDGRQI